MRQIPFTNIDWVNVPKEYHSGETGTAIWQSIHYLDFRIRIVEYSANYKANHWCQKGHIVHCLEGEFITEHQNGTQYILKKGMTYVVSDDLSSHRSLSENGVRLLIIDGNFLKLDEK